MREKMTRWISIERAAWQTRGYWLRRMGAPWLCILMMAWMSWSGCASPRVLTGNETVTLVRAGQSLTATNDSYLVSAPMMKRILRAIGDEILKEQTSGALGTSRPTSKAKD